ncbi:MAG: glycosyltransferase family 4 protein [Magnetococcales bacterium]|nr:glycosyltransferase family 4 protein [Magnetococcales bacterium]
MMTVDLKATPKMNADHVSGHREYPENALSKQCRRHILIVFHTSLPEIKGGINKMIVSLAQGWIQRGHQVSILSPGEWNDRVWSTKQYGSITIHRQRLRVPWDKKNRLRGLLGWMVEFPQVIWKLLRFVRKEKVDLIHLHTPREYQYVIRVLRGLGGPPYVLTFHGTDALHFSKGQANHMPLLRWIARGALAITAVAKHYAALIEAHHPSLAPVHVIANGIPVSSNLEALPQTQPFVHDGPMASNPRLLSLPARFFIQVGWVEPPKAPDVTVRAWGLLQAEHPDLHVLIIGDEPFLHANEPYYPGYLQQVKHLASDLGCETTVHFTGGVHPALLTLIMRQAQGLVFPSHMEGMPYVLLEAGLAGLPVICSDIPAFRELIDHENNGLLFPRDDHEALAAAVNRLLEDETLGRVIGGNLRQKIVTHHDAATMAAAYMRLFQSLLSTCTGRGG